MQLNTIIVRAPEGWTVTSPSANGTPTGDSLTITPNITISASTSYNFSLSLSAPCDATGSMTSIELTSAFTFNESGMQSGPSTTISAASTSVVTASLSDGTLPPVPFSLQSRTNTGSLAMAVQNPNRCSGWSVSISATDLGYTGAAPGEPTIPAGSLRVTGSGLTAMPLSPEPRQIIDGGGANTSYAYDMTLALNIPAGAPAGRYTTTITVNTTSAP